MPQDEPGRTSFMRGCPQRATASWVRQFERATGEIRAHLDHVRAGEPGPPPA